MIERHLSTEGCGKVAQQIELMVVAQRVSLHSRQELFFKSNRLGILANSSSFVRSTFSMRAQKLCG